LCSLSAPLIILLLSRYLGRGGQNIFKYRYPTSLRAFSNFFYIGGQYLGGEGGVYQQIGVHIVVSNVTRNNCVIGSNGVA
jgi:hypothetical protein